MLSDTAIKNAKPGLKPDPKDKTRKIPTDTAYKLADEIRIVRADTADRR